MLNKLFLDDKFDNQI